MCTYSPTKELQRDYGGDVGGDMEEALEDQLQLKVCSTVDSQLLTAAAMEEDIQSTGKILCFQNEEFPKVCIVAKGGSVKFEKKLNEIIGTEKFLKNCINLLKSKSDQLHC